MAFSMKALIIVAGIVAVVLPHSTLATEYVVGDTDGWRLGVNYTTWAQGKEFLVGDALVFNYNKAYHTVCTVNGTAFQACNIPPKNESLSSGNDTVVLDTAGMKWFICGAPAHCQLNQKLAINVTTAPTPAPTP